MADVEPIAVEYFTDPYCPWSWAAEPHLRRLQVEFDGQLELTFVIVGLAPRFGDTRGRAIGAVAASAASGMPVDPRIYLEDAPSSSHPAGLALAAVSEQGDPGTYLRRLREAILLERRRMDTGPALLDLAREVGGLDLERLRIDFGSNAIMERFGGQLDAARRVDARHHEPGTGRVRTPALELRAPGGEIHGVYGYQDYETWRAAAQAAGGTAARDRPGVEEALRRFNTMATPEVASVCGLAGPRAPAELWALALDWRVTPRRVVGGELWSLA